MRGASGEGLAVNNGGGNALLWFNFLIVGHQDLGAIGLTVNVNQQNFFALVGEASGERDSSRGFTHATFLGSDRNNHRNLIALEADTRVFQSISNPYTIAGFIAKNQADFWEQ